MGIEHFPWKQDEKTLWCTWSSRDGCRCTVDPCEITAQIADKVNTVLRAFVEALETICHAVPFLVEQLDELRRRSLDLVASGETPCFPRLLAWSDEPQSEVIQYAYGNLFEAHRIICGLKDLEEVIAENDDSEVFPSAQPWAPPGHIVYLFSGPACLKIGFTTNVAARFADLRTSVPMKLSVAGMLQATRALEKELHGRFFRYRLRGEWYQDVPEIREFFATDYRRVEPEPGAFPEISMLQLCALENTG